MKQEMLSIYDSKARAFISPWFAINLQVAARSFADVVNNPAQVIHNNPEDFTLYHLGTFDDADASIVELVPPVCLGLAINFKEQKNVR